MAWETRAFSGRDHLPVVTVVIGWSQSVRRERARRGDPLPEFLDIPPTDALVDTGSFRTFVPEDFVARLGLQPVGRGPVRQALGLVEHVTFYAASVAIITCQGVTWKQHAVVPSLPVGVLPTRGDSARTLPMPILGRDVLSTCVIQYDGPARQLSILTTQPSARRPKR